MQYYKTVYQSSDYDRAKVKAHYIRYDPSTGLFKWCETYGGVYDVRQGEIEEQNVPADIARFAREASHQFPSYIAWKGVEFYHES